MKLRSHDDKVSESAVDLRPFNRLSSFSSSPPRLAIFSPHDPENQRTIDWETTEECVLSRRPPKFLPPAPCPSTYGSRSSRNSTSIHSRKEEPTNSPYDFRRRDTRRAPISFLAVLVMSVILIAGIGYSVLVLLGRSRDLRQRQIAHLQGSHSSQAYSSFCSSHFAKSNLKQPSQERLCVNYAIGEGSQKMRELQPEDGWMAMTANQEPEIAFDYALASLGAKILSTRQTHHISLLEARLLGITVYRGNSLESLEDAPLQPLVIPGRCWRFRDFPGTLVIQLAEEITVNAFSLSHVLGLSVPPNRLRSAPREFEVWGLRRVDEDPTERHFFGNYSFQLHLHESTQRFPVQFPADYPVPIVEVNVLSNQGSPDFTCVYRFKVFGVAANDATTF